MDLLLDDETEAFRAEVREFLVSNVPNPPLPSYDSPEGAVAHRQWERTLYDAGFSAVSWPKEYGGRDVTLLQWVIFEEEYFKAGAPARISQNGMFLLGPTLFAHGSKDQLDRVLPKMANGEEIWAQAWSEPESGSDLASLRSPARKVDGGWRLSGQKIWSSRAPFADRAFGLFRSDPDAQRHQGLTYFMFDLKAEGITVRPIPQLDGDPGFAEIFLDDVFVPDEDVIGAVHDGWRVAMSTSSNERGMSLRSPGRFLATADRLVELWKSVPENEFASERVADAWIAAQAYRLHTFG
ncbi:acyl-CoA dehydrogenase family protein, partial [Mycobacteroides abscessus]